MTKDAADRARKVATKSNDPAYSDTKFAAFKGKVRGGAGVVKSVGSKTRSLGCATD